MVYTLIHRCYYPERKDRSKKYSHLTYFVLLLVTKGILLKLMHTIAHSLWIFENTNYVKNYRNEVYTSVQIECSVQRSNEKKTPKRNELKEITLTNPNKANADRKQK
ncbi:hypothetical protein BDZ91DRAFT_427983 [Kalaharituber pfeilii]|nr:hypothetical protein BDZ91DRAFT_427983 [Kalaharituber pfeilii]